MLTPNFQTALMAAINGLRAQGLTPQNIGALFSNCYAEHIEEVYGVDPTRRARARATQSVAAITPGSAAVPPSSSAGTPTTEGSNPITSKDAASTGVTTPEEEKAIPEAVANATSAVGETIANELGLKEQQQVKTETAVIEAITKTEAVAKVEITKTENIKVDVIASLSEVSNKKTEKPKEKKPVFMTECGGVYGDSDWESDAEVEGPQGYGYGPVDSF
ncbi:hypothetical protein N0V88_006241 [Collariella sp. IMI 366227]|nr:hypothetical protein N0V88_006241 [Collariella sp. IMI 366227]